MFTPVRGRTLVVALALAVTTPASFAQLPPPAPPRVEVETPPTHLPDLPDMPVLPDLGELLEMAGTPIAVQNYLPGADALDRLLAPTLIPLPGAEAFDWFAADPVMPLPGAVDPCLTCAPANAPAGAPAPTFGGPLSSRPKLFGDVGGLRSRFAERGMNWDIYSTNFFGDVANGGLQESLQYRGRMDYLLNVNGEKAGLWKGLFVDLHGETVYGNSINQYTGTIMPVSIGQLFPVPNGSATALTGVKITQALSERFIVYGGKLNLLDGFNQPFTGGARGVNGFWNGGMLFNPVFIRTVPYSTYGFGAAVLQGLEPIFSFTVLDANNTPTVSGFNTFFNNGVVLLPQINIPTNFFGLPGHQGLVGTWSSRRYANTDRSAFLNVIQGGAPISTLRRDGAWSLGYMFDQALHVSPCDPKRMWGVFGNLGIADTNPSPVRWFANIGIGGSALRGRPLDTFGLGYYYMGLNGSFKNLIPGVPLRDEHGVEAFYNYAVTPWCHITPDVQFVLPAQERAQHLWFLGLRAKFDF